MEGAMSDHSELIRKIIKAIQSRGGVASNMLNETISNLKCTDCLDEWHKQKVEEE